MDGKLKPTDVIVVPVKSVTHHYPTFSVSNNR